MSRPSIATEDEMTPENARVLRASLGQTQAEFWSAAGITKASGSAAERGTSVPKANRRLLFLAHVVGLDVDCSSPRNVENLRALAALQGDTTALLRAGATRAQLEHARDKINEAIEAMKEIDTR